MRPRNTFASYYKRLVGLMKRRKWQGFVLLGKTAHANVYLVNPTPEWWATCSSGVRK